MLGSWRCIPLLLIYRHRPLFFSLVPRLSLPLLSTLDQCRAAIQPTPTLCMSMENVTNCVLCIIHGISLLKERSLAVAADLAQRYLGCAICKLNSSLTHSWETCIHGSITHALESQSPLVDRPFSDFMVRASKLFTKLSTDWFCQCCLAQCSAWVISGRIWMQIMGGCHLCSDWDVTLGRKLTLQIDAPSSPFETVFMNFA